jgi:hypothetical protein
VSARARIAGATPKRSPVTPPSLRRSFVDLSI